MEKQSNVLSNSRTVRINFDPRIPISELKMVLEKIGPIVRFHAFSAEDQTIALITFKTAEQAKKAIGMEHIMTSKIMEEKATQTDPIVTTPSKQTKSEAFSYPLIWLPMPNATGQEGYITRYEDLANTYSINQIPNSRLKAPVQNITRPELQTTHYVDEVNTRIYCQIPYSGPVREREEKFLIHFSKFGPLIYHQILNDIFGQPSLGYVCYRNLNDARVALLWSDPIYKARPAEPRKMSILDLCKPAYERQVYHTTCGMLLERSIYNLHENTCRKLRQLQYRSATTIVGKPVMYEQATKSPKSTESAALDCPAKKSKLTIGVGAIQEDTVDQTQDRETTTQLVSLNEKI